MLKYSTGRGKPGWGKDCTRPPWWPKHVPWANVRMDARNDEQKSKVRLFRIYISYNLYITKYANYSNKKLCYKYEA